MFFGFFFISIFLAYFFFAKAVVYLGVLSGIILIFLGITLAATGYVEQVTCFSNRVNETISQGGNYTEYGYTTSCHTESLPLSRDFINAIGTIMMFIGAGISVDSIYQVSKKRKE